MIDILPQLTLDTPIKSLKHMPAVVSRNVIFVLKEMGVTTVEDLLRMNPTYMLWLEGVTKEDMLQIVRFQIDYRELLDCPLLSVARKLCHTAHEGQTDKAGMPYYLHPERVAARCHTCEEKIVALLHDTIEDTFVTPDLLLNHGFSDEIVTAVLSVTKRDGESYDDFVARAKANHIGRQVKIHDLEDNMDITRLNVLSDSTMERLRKYLRAYHFLLS